MKPPAPVGVATLMERMPNWFVEHAKRTERRAQRRRDALAKRFGLVFLGAVEAKDDALSEWQDTVVNFREVQ